MKVVLTDYRYDSISSFIEVFKRRGVDFEIFQCESKKELLNATEFADGVITHFSNIDNEVIANMKNCKAVIRSGIGLEVIDIPSATAKRIAVMNVPRYCVQDVSDHVLMFMLALNKRLRVLDNSVHQGKWDYNIAKPITRLSEKTLGLVGFGAIAREVAKKVLVFGMNVVAYDPYISQEEVSLPVKMCSSDELLFCSDVISIHIPLTGETKGLFDESVFFKMKKHPIVINTARGSLIKEADLINALKSGIVSGVGLDVLEEEKICTSNKLLSFDNVLITPHSAWYSEQSIQTLQSSAAEEICNYLEGKPAIGVANKFL